MTTQELSEVQCDSHWINLKLLMISVITVLVGGYALGLLEFMKPLYSGLVLGIEGLVIDIYLVRYLKKAPEGYLDPFSIMMGYFCVIVVGVITILICLIHFWWPKTAAGIGTVINLAAIILLAVSYLQEWSKEKRARPTQQPA